MADKGSSSGASDNFALSQVTQEVKPRGLIEALGEIERAYVNEVGGTLVDPRRLTTPMRIEYMEIGGRSGLVSGLVMVLVTPLAVGVLEKLIPIFGSLNPSLFDEICGFLLALIFPLCYSFLFAGAALNHLGGYSRGMVNNLLGGMAAASAVKALVIFIGFHFIYFKFLTDKNLAWAVQKLYVFKISYERAISILAWTRNFRHVFITSSYFILLSTVILIAVPYAAFLWAHLRNKKLIDAGVVNVFQQNS